MKETLKYRNDVELDILLPMWEYNNCQDSSMIEVERYGGEIEGEVWKFITLEASEV
jgi:hypothetical protein